MDMISNILENPTMQGLVLGPLIGALLGVLFSGLSSAPSQNEPKTIVKTREVYRERIIERRSSNSNDNDGAGLFIVFGFGIVFILWKYAIHVELIQHYIAVGILTVLSFSIVTIGISFLKGQFTSEEWWIYTISPTVILSVCIYVLNLARTSFDPRITENALHYNVIEFYTKGLTDFGRAFMVSHVAGIIFLVSVIALTACSLLHYLSLMNQRSHSLIQGFWGWLTRITLFFSGLGWLVLAIILLILSYISINPNLAASWFS